MAGGSEDKESSCKAGDPGSIPGSGRSPGEFHGQRSLVGHGPQGHKESHKIDQLSLLINLSNKSLGTSA